MNLLVIGTVIVAIVVLGRFRLPYLLWIFIWPAAIYVILRFGITPLVPASVLKIYLWIVCSGLLAYLFADVQRSKEVSGQLFSFMTKREYGPFLAAVMIALPVGLATKIYFDVSKEVRAPTFGRTIHPAPPSEITFNGKSMDLTKQKNPFRELEHSDKAKFKEHVANGKRVYYQNCVYCHGDDMNGDGIFAHGFIPVPAQFNAETIGMLQEAYLFWRIAKGGPGLPEESGPWSSSMPAWEKFLEEDEVWDVILFLYDYKELKPRAEEEHH